MIRVPADASMMARIWMGILAETSAGFESGFCNEFWEGVSVIYSQGISAIIIDGYLRIDSYKQILRCAP